MTDLAAFPIGNRRAVIARLATRALAVLAAPPARVEPVPIAAASAVFAPGAAAAPAWPPPERVPAPLPFPTPTTQIPPPFVATPRPATGTWSAYPFPSSIILYQAGQGYPKFDQAKADAYFAAVVAKMTTLTTEVIEKWNQAGIFERQKD